ncbi:MAG: cation-translocating P-type ATPase [Candidatus Aquicultor sp.]
MASRNPISEETPETEPESGRERLKEQLVPVEQPVSQVIRSLDTDPEKGLTGSEVARRLAKYGPNRLVEPRTVSFLDIFWEEVREPMILLLLVVAVVYSIWGKFGDFLTIVFVVVALVFAEVYNEYRAKHAITALKQLSSPMAPVIRDGRFQEVRTEDLVPGDILLLRVGERIQADGRLIEAFGLQVDESALTGESVPVSKNANATVTRETPLAEQVNEVFAGTVVTRGKGRAVVTATGMSTELGRITGLVREAKEPKTPLQLAMRELAGWLVYVAVFFSIAIPLIGFLEGRPFRTMVLTGLSLAFATIPEELPIIITMVLGLGALQLSRQHALVKRLRAAETLGNVTVIATDKTGTLTENQMVLSRIVTDNRITELGNDRLTPLDRELLQVGVLVNDSIFEKEDGQLSLVGDPMEVALIRAFIESGQRPQEVRQRFHLRNEFSFDTELKLMSAVFELNGSSYVYVKGAPEAVLSRSANYLTESGVAQMTPEKLRDELKKVDAFAEEGLRVLAFAYKETANGERLTREQAESDLRFVGIAGFLDPPRADAAQAIRTTQDAGIRVLMLTGDYPLTARAIAKAVGIVADGTVVTSREIDRMSDEELQQTVKNTSIFARITPENKLRIVRVLKRNRQVVAVTGDGINDAPALSEADIGIAMGETGTDVAREAADMVLTDDNFSTIAFAVQSGRRMYDNLRKGVRYYLAVKLGLISIFLLPVLLGIPLPFAPIQIIVLELFMDLGASAAFVAEPGEKDLMMRFPRDPNQRFMDPPMLRTIVLGGISLFLAVSTVYLVANFTTGNTLVAQSSAFATWMFGHIFLAFNMRSDRQPLSSLGLFSNGPMDVWAIGAIGLLVVAITTPLLHSALKLTYLNAGQWLFAIAVAFVFTFWMEVRKHALRRGSST